MSCSGTLTEASTPPDSKDEVRVASDLIGVKTISVRLWRGFLFHQFGFAAKTLFTSTSRDFMMKGPVPLVLRLAKFSFFCARSFASVAWLASDQRLLMMSSCISSLGRMGNGVLVS